MKRRNWLDLSRKLVDRYDLDDTLSYIQSSLGQEALAYWGNGVLITKTYPNPFPITLSGSILGGTVGPGIAYDTTGQLIQNDGSVAFVATSNASNPRWSLLVARYKMTGDTPVPKPSDPITTISLNLHDDFDIVVIPGTPAASPAYPAKLTNDVIIAGLQIPAAATLGTQIVVDTTIQEQAYVPATRVTVDTTQLVVTKKKDVQSQINSYDAFLLLGALTLSSDNTVHDYAFITCNSGGVNGDTITIAGQTFTIGTNAALAQIPVQASAQALAYELARRLRELPAFSNVYTAAAANGKIALYAIQPGAVGGALSVTGTSFSVDRAALSGNGPRKILNLPGIAAQLDQADFYMSTLVPPGMMVPFAGPTSAIPSGWLAAQGASVLRSAYPNLFSAIGTAWGAADATHFSLPDMRGRSVRGVDHGAGRDPDRASRFAATGGNSGDNVGSYQDDQYALHNHGLSDPGHNHTVNDPSHSHGVSDPGHGHTAFGGNRTGNFCTYVGQGFVSDFNNGWNNDWQNPVNSVGTGIGISGAGTGISINNRTTGITISSSGGNETRMKNANVEWIIKY